MAFILFIQFSWEALAAPSDTILASAILNPNSVPGIFVLSVADYEDIRIDFNLDGKIDFWRLKNGEITVEIEFENNKLTSYYIHKIKGARVIESSYEIKNGSLELTFAKNRTFREMYFSEGRDICIDNYNSLKKELASYSEVEESAIRSMVSKLIDPGCKGLLGRSYIRAAQYTLSVLSSKDDTTSCIKNAKFESYFPNDEKTKLGLAIFKTRYFLQTAQLRKDLERHIPLIKCERHDDERRSATSYSTLEQGTIKISLPPGKKEENIDTSKLRHEFLHRSGLTSEDSVNKILEVCKKIHDDNSDNVVASSTTTIMPVPDVNEGVLKAADSSTADTAAAANRPIDKIGKQNGIQSSIASKGIEAQKESLTNTEKYQGNVKAAEVSTANIPKTLTVAQTNVPSAEALSEPIYSNPQKTPIGMETAYKNSVAQSSGVLKTANNLIGAMNTQAEAATLAAGKAQAREVASMAAAQKIDTAALAGTSTSGLTTRNVIKPGETIVEQITIDDKPNRAATNAGTNSAANRFTTDTSATASTTAATTGATGNTQPTQTRNAVTPAEVSANNTVVNPAADFSSASLGSGSGSAQRQPAAINRGTAQRTSEVANTSRDEMITFISRGDYELTKRRLREPAFTKQLESQSITILDLYGNSYGAKKGELLFLDQGDRFVRQK